MTSSCPVVNVTSPYCNNPVYFLLIVLRTRGESWESKVKEDEMTYFLGHFCADKKLILIKPTLKYFQSM